MNRNLRFVIAVALLVSVLLLARNPAAWAINTPSQESATIDTDAVSAPQDPGSVKPPSTVVIPETAGTYSVGGVCTLNVVTLAEGIRLTAELLEFDTLGTQPEEISRYLAGVCSLVYQKSGEFVTEIAPADGEVEICFADVPNSTNQIFVYNEEAWTPLETIEEDGLKCAAASKTGKYVLSEVP